MGTVLAVANQKGGVGKTTTAVNLGASIADAGYRTLLVDLDPQCNATVALGLPKDGGASVYDCLSGELTLTAAAVPSGIDRLDVVPSTPDLAGANVELPRIAGSETTLRDRLGSVRDRYLFTLLDCPPSLGPAHRQRAGGGRQGDRPGPDRVLRARGARAAARHALADPARAEPAAHGRGDDPHDARRAHAAGARRRARGARALPRRWCSTRSCRATSGSARRRASASRSCGTRRTAPGARRT